MDVLNDFRKMIPDYLVRLGVSEEENESVAKEFEALKKNVN